MVELIDMILHESKSDQRTIKSSLHELLTHMLKCKYQNDYPDKKSWRKTISYEHNQIKYSFDTKNGSFKGSLYKKFYMKDLDLESIYKDAVRSASRETRMSANSFPSQCEWTKSQLINGDFIDEFLRTYGY